MRKQFLTQGFHVREVNNGFILEVGADIFRGGVGETFVFQTEDQLTSFIKNYIEDKLV
jgi:hypothetical protein